MEWKKINRMEAKSRLKRWEEAGQTGFYQMANDLDTSAGNLEPIYRSLRSDLLKAWKDTQDEVDAMKDEQGRKNYLVDLIFGAKLFKILEERGMDIRLASFDQLWFYLGMDVVPEITFERFGSEDDGTGHGFRIPGDHYCLKSSRIYLKVLWWYIFLSMRLHDDGRYDLEATVKMLWHQNTDTIMQVVERTGRDGYRLDVYRELVRYKCEHPSITAEEFRRAMILNTARTQIMEPDLCEGGYLHYVKELYEYIGK